MGESMGSEELIMPMIDACSIACGGHIGDKHSMNKTIELANEHGVKIGAHPSYPDKINFGRTLMQISPSDLVKSLTEQISSLKQCCSEKNVTLHHIKAHGALYNRSAEDLETAKVLLQAMEFFPEAPLYVPWNSVLQKILVAHNKPFILEAFADRRYIELGQLLSRKIAGSVITDPEEIVLQIKNISETQQVITDSGKIIEMQAETFCVHGDNPNVLEILKSLNQ